MEAGILDLLRQAKARTGLTDEEIGVTVDLPVKKNFAQAVQDVLRRKRMIHVVLADWALAQTLYAKDGVTEALVALRRAGLTEDQIAGVLTLLKSYGFTPAIVAKHGAQTSAHSAGPTKSAEPATASGAADADARTARESVAPSAELDPELAQVLAVRPDAKRGKSGAPSLDAPTPPRTRAARAPKTPAAAPKPPEPALSAAGRAGPKRPDRKQKG